jgi:TolA-binding protein
MATSQEMLELLKRIQERIDQLEDTFSKEVDLIQSENKEIKDIIAVITNPPLRKPERPEVFIPANNSFVDDSSFEDVTIETVFSVLEMPPLMLLPKQSLATPQQQFSQLVYMSAVFAYQREEYKEALNYFLALSFTGANQWTVGNVLYWMADCYRQGKEYNSALIMLDKLLVMENPGRATDALIQKGLIYRTLGKEELAMIMFRDLLDDYPESDYARLVGMELNSVELY